MFVIFNRNELEYLTVIMDVCQCDFPRLRSVDYETIQNWISSSDGQRVHYQRCRFANWQIVFMILY